MLEDQIIEYEACKACNNTVYLLPASDDGYVAYCTNCRTKYYFDYYLTLDGNGIKWYLIDEIEFNKGVNDGK